MRLRWYHVLVALGSSCSLYGGGADAPNGGSDGAAIDGGFTDVVSEPAPPQPCTTASTQCMGSLPMGWTPIVSIPANASCPQNFTQKDIVKDAVAMDGACGCGCTIVTQPSCAKGNFDVKWGTNGCTADWNLAMAEGACNATNFVQVASKNSLPAPTLTNGTCMANAPMSDPQKVAHTAARVCEVPMECREDVCSGNVPTGETACVEHADDVACPAGFATKAGVFGDSVSIMCSGCSSCAVTAQCGTGTLRYFSDANCTNATSTVKMDGQCNDTNATGNATYYKYDAPVMNVACAATGSKSAVDLVGKRTVCCKP